MLIVSIQRGADSRHMLHGSPQTTNVYGKSAPIRVQLQKHLFARSLYGGDCAAIELYVFAFLSDCEGKITQFSRNSN